MFKKYCMGTLHMYAMWFAHIHCDYVCVLKWNGFNFHFQPWWRNQDQTYPVVINSLYQLDCTIRSPYSWVSIISAYVCVSEKD
jgi:hypothetical protein